MKCPLFLYFYAQLILTTEQYNPKIPGINVVIDISRNNALVNFARAKDDGIQGILHKATHGTKWKDPKYHHRKKHALQQGLLWGAYHSGTEKPGTAQAQHFLKVIGETKDMLLALDTEDQKQGVLMTMVQIEEFVSEVKNKTGRYPLIYGSDHLMQMVKGRDTVLLQCPLWLAQYNMRAFVPKNTWMQWSLWQYTDGSTGPIPHIVSGIGRCDRDSINDQLYDTVEKMWSQAGK